MRTTVVVPTYNERENIDPLIDAILQLPVPDLSLLIVDDSSPDGTGKVVRQRAAAEPRVQLLSRPRKEGLGRAYTAAFRELAATTAPPDVIAQMDADFSHAPTDLPRLLSAIDTADVVIGSRYVPGGGTKNWDRRRRYLSRGANTYARLLTGVQPHDLTGGFNAWRRTVLSAIAPETIRADGYGYLIELKVRASRLGARIAEVPITFVERRVGQSKLSKKVLWEAATVVLRLGLERRKFE